MFHDCPFIFGFIVDVIDKIEAKHAREHEAKQSVATILTLGRATQINRLGRVVAHTNTRVVERRGHFCAERPFFRFKIIRLDRVQRFASEIMLLGFVVPLTTECVDFIVKNASTKVKSLKKANI
jgi:hypothetical protein